MSDPTEHEDKWFDVLAGRATADKPELLSAEALRRSIIARTGQPLDAHVERKLEEIFQKIVGGQASNVIPMRRRGAPPTAGSPISEFIRRAAADSKARDTEMVAPIFASDGARLIFGYDPGWKPGDPAKSLVFQCPSGQADAYAGVRVFIQLEGAVIDLGICDSTGRAVSGNTQGISATRALGYWVETP